ncbi:MAG: integrase family protein [Betaproteobacteria bacterium]|nr:integrase family protein [Betaproteobacteria bacterium]
MSLFKRGNTWWIDFTTPSGERVRCSACTEDKAQAKELHDKLKYEAWRVSKLGEKPRRTWDEAAIRWLAESQHNATYEESKGKLRWLQTYLRGRALDEIDREFVYAIGEAKAKETSAATANRTLGLIRSVLRKAAYEWEWIGSPPRIKLYREAKRRIRWITPEQASVLLRELPEHQRVLAQFALATGLRQSNVIGLEWSQVDLKRRVAWIHADQAKAGKPIHVSLNSVAVQILQRQIGEHGTRVFTFRGNPIRQVNTKAWHNALKRAGIENFRWHDLRHTWASWLVQHGTPLNVVQEMGAWESEGMVRRYAHLAPAHLAAHAEVVAGLLGGTSAAQLEVDDLGNAK